MARKLLRCPFCPARLPSQAFSYHGEYEHIVTDELMLELYESGKLIVRSILKDCGNSTYECGLCNARLNFDTSVKHLVLLHNIDIRIIQGEEIEASGLGESAKNATDEEHEPGNSTSSCPQPPSAPTREEDGIGDYAKNESLKDSPNQSNQYISRANLHGKETKNTDTGCPNKTQPSGKSADETQSLNDNVSIDTKDDLSQDCKKDARSTQPTVSPARAGTSGGDYQEGNESGQHGRHYSNRHLARSILNDNKSNKNKLVGPQVTERPAHLEDEALSDNFSLDTNYEFLNDFNHSDPATVSQSNVDTDDNSSTYDMFAEYYQNVDKANPQDVDRNVEPPKEPASSSCEQPNLDNNRQQKVECPGETEKANPSNSKNVDGGDKSLPAANYDVAGTIEDEDGSKANVAPPSSNDNVANNDGDGEHTSNDRKLLTLVVGKKFETLKEGETYVNDFFVQNHTHCKIRTRSKTVGALADKHPYERLNWCCIHGKKPEPKKNDIRPNQKISKLGCNYEVTLRLNKKTEKFWITKFVEKHNHPTSKEYYVAIKPGKVMTEEQKRKYFDEYITKVGATTSKVSDLLAKEEEIPMNTQQIRNEIRKRTKGIHTDLNDLAVADKYLRDLVKKDKNAVYKVFFTWAEEIRDISQKADMKILYFQSGFMRKVLANNCHVLFVDATYKLSCTGYVLVNVVAIDPHGYGHIVAWALVSDENKETITETLKTVVRFNPDIAGHVHFFMLDKDMSEIAAIKHVFPNAKHILCRYHVLDAVKRKIHSIGFLHSEVDLKEDSRKAFAELLYAKTDKAYSDVLIKLENMGKSNQHCKQFYDYVLTYWHVNRENWAYHHTRTYQLYGSYTNNYCENINKQIKDDVRKHLPFSSLVVCLTNFNDKQKRKVFLRNLHRTFKVATINDGKDSVERGELLDWANEHNLCASVLSVLMQEFHCNRAVKLTDCNVEEGQITCPLLPEHLGPCSHFNSNKLPCRHLFRVRLSNYEPILNESMFDPYHLRMVDNNTEEPNHAPDEEDYTFDKMPTFKKADQTLAESEKELHTLLNHYDRATRKDKLKFLIYFLTFWDYDFNNRDSQYQPTPEDEPVTINDMSIGRKRKTHIKNTGLTNKKFKRPITPADQVMKEWMIKVNEYHDGKFSLRQLVSISTRDHPMYDPYFSVKHIDAAGVLLAAETNITMQSTTLSATAGFLPILPNTAQILHVGSSHWIVVSNIGVRDYEHKIKLYDFNLVLTDRSDAQSFRIDSTLLWQIAALMKAHGYFTIEVEPCQQQKKFPESGPLSIALACQLGFNLPSPCEVVFTGDLRKQFQTMLIENKVSPFITANKSSRPTAFQIEVKNKKGTVSLQDLRSKDIHVETICHCLLPVCFDNTFLCDSCDKQYHCSCYLLPLEFVKASKNMYCYNCKPGTLPKEYASFKVNQKEQLQFITDISTCPATILQHCKLEAEKRVYKLRLEKKSQVNKFYKTCGTYGLLQVTTAQGAICEAVNNRLKVLHESPLQLNPAEWLHFVAVLVAKLHNIELPPLSYSKPKNRNKAEFFELRNKDWITTLRLAVTKVGNQIERFQMTRKMTEHNALVNYAQIVNSITEARAMCKDMIREFDSVDDLLELPTDSQARVNKFVADAMDMLLKLDAHELEVNEMRRQTTSY